MSKLFRLAIQVGNARLTPHTHKATVRLLMFAQSPAAPIIQ
jgi:hypothetical protein